MQPQLVLPPFLLRALSSQTRTRPHQHCQHWDQGIGWVQLGTCRYFEMRPPTVPHLGSLGVQPCGMISAGYGQIEGGKLPFGGAIWIADSIRDPINPTLASSLVCVGCWSVSSVGLSLVGLSSQSVMSCLSVWSVKRPSFHVLTGSVLLPVGYV
ncbi:hypothetical protein GE09DRAFT_524982 [Coniochaeta sp. 2T2.1]|nr:hypothetical protein GE09DRAFT_524982 [Coniochaeta sp. 2T2.1]